MEKSYFLSSILIVFSLSLHSQVAYQNNASTVGVDFSCGITPSGSGVSFYDFDNDGWDDITFATGNGKDLQFFKNNGGTFSAVALNIPALNYQTRQVNWVDIDNDGDKDLFVASDTNGNKLFENTGNLNFQDITVASGLYTQNLHTYGASWGDYNKDGFLDVFLSNRDDSPAISQTPNYLFKNNGDGTFTDVSVSAGIDSDYHISFCSAFMDYNNDGWQDIYVSNDKPANPNLLYKNNGDGTFTEVGEASNSNVAINAMTVTVGDYNNDGWQDIYVTDVAVSAFLKNNGDGTFTDVVVSSGTTFDAPGWGAIFLDADNDMDIDLYVSGSLYNNPSYASAAFYENLNDGTFQIPTGAGFENDESHSHSNAIGDINNDGLPDFVVSNTSNQDIFLWENQCINSNNWLKVSLEGTTNNRDGIGSLIELTINGLTQSRYTFSGEGYLSQNSGSEFFGLGTNTTIDELKITWLNGVEDVFYNVASNQSLKIVEGSALSVDEFVKPSVLVYPNPTSDYISIKTNNTVDEVRIYNSILQLVYKNKSIDPSKPIDISRLESGMYFLKATVGTQTETMKIVKR